MLVSKNQLLKETNQSPKDAGPIMESIKMNPIVEDGSTTEENLALIEDTPIARVLKVPQITEQENEKRKENRKNMIEAKAPEPVDFAYERAIGNNDSVYTNFIELIALTKRKVARIVIKEGDKKVGYASGFMVSENLMLTNWHVFQNREMAQTSEAHFFYEYDVFGRPMMPVIFKMDASKFYNDQSLDYCFVGIESKDVTDSFDLKQIGWLYLDKSLGKIGEVGVEKLNIIHHPLGDYKQLSIRENKFVGIDGIKLYYDTDTAQGSSGSAVLNDQWQVVGLHHKSIAKMTEDGKTYLDKDDNPIPEINGKIDITKVVWLKNEGIRISAILEHLESNNPNNPVIAGISKVPTPENLRFIVNENQPNHNPQNESLMDTNNSKNILISVPVDALSSEKSIDISLSTKNMVSMTITENKSTSTATEAFLQEAARVSKEDEMDFSACQGYISSFLGQDVPMPQPTNDTKKEMAKLKDRSIELKYFNYSLIFNAVRRMPLISAVNVSGDASLRTDDSERSDNWLRDNRIDKACQLNNDYYSDSHFDRGHMSRYQDAKWTFPISKTNELRNGVYTCFYTNACPQVPSLNRAPGLWGKLEKAVLEKGIKKQTKASEIKMTVFNGPIFNKDTDKIYKGVRVPMEFFKIIVWVDDNDKLKATGFRLSQILLVGGVHFDESMDLEALDINLVPEFKNYQCSIKSISEATKIDFKGLDKFDTFKAVDKSSNESLLLTDTESIKV